MSATTVTRRVSDALPDRGAEWIVVGLLAVLPWTPLFSSHAPGGFLVRAAATGAILALHAMGVVLVHRTNRFLHLAQVAVALSASTLFVGFVNGAPLLRAARAMCGCVATPPGPIAYGVNFVLAIGLTVGIAVGISVLAHQTLFRRFSRAPRLMPTLVSIFLGQTLMSVQGRLLRILTPSAPPGLTTDELAAFGSTFAGPTPPPVDLAWTLGEIDLHLADLAPPVVALLLVLGITRYLRRTSAGVGIRAAAENPERAATLGLDVAGVTTRVWVIAGVLAGAAGILIAMRTGAGELAGPATAALLPVDQLVLLLTAAVIARFEGLGLALAGGMLLEVLRAATSWSFNSSAPFDAAVVLLVGGLLLLQRDRGRGTRHDQAGFLELVTEPRPIPRELRDLPTVRMWRRVAATVVGVGVVAFPWVGTAQQVSLAGTFLVFAMVGLSLLVLTGWAGQVSLGQWGFATVGAWVAAASGLPVPVALVAAALVGAVVAVALGFPALRLKGLQLAIATLAFAWSVSFLLLDIRYLGGKLPTALDQTLFGLSFADARVSYYGLLLALVGFVVSITGLRRSRFGRALIAARNNDDATQAVGIDTRRLRLAGFAVAGAYAAVAGALLAFQQGTVAASSFRAEDSILVFAFSVIGGLGGVAGPIVGAAFHGSLTLFGTNPVLQYVSAGLGGLLLLVFAPGGIAEVGYRVRDAALRRLAIRHRIPVPSLLGDRGAALLTAAAPVLEPQPGVSALPEVRYEPDGQWALDRYGRDDATDERVGAMRAGDVGS